MGRDKSGRNMTRSRVRLASRRWRFCRLGIVLFFLGTICSSSNAFTPYSRDPANRALTRLPSSPSSQTEARSWIIPKGVSFGSLDKLRFEPETAAAEEPGYCTISTRAIGLNFADIFCVLGLYSAANQVRGGTNDEAFCPGLEYAGIVMDDPTGTYTKGQRVLGFSRFGAYADIVKVPPHFLYPLPDSWTFSEGASFLVQALTAWHGLVEVGGMPIVNDSDGSPLKQVVLIHSAAGGVGLWASEIAARRGATVVGVIGTTDKQQTFDDRILELASKSRTLLRGEEQTFGRRLAELLCDMHGLPPSELPEKKELEYLRNQGYGIDTVMESLGGQYFTDSFEALNRGGSLVTFGSTSYVSPGLSLNKLRLIWRYLTRPRIDPGDLTSRNVRLAGFNLIFLTDMPSQLRRELKECIFCLGGYTTTDDNLRLLDDHPAFVPLDPVTAPVIGATFDFRQETVDALECLKSGGTVGKVVLENFDNRSA